MDFNTILSLNQTIHNLGAVLFGAGPFYFLLLIHKRKKTGGAFHYPLDRTMEETFATSLTIWLVFLVLQGVSGAGFGLLSLIYEGSIPEVAPIALAALTVKVIGAAACFFISLYLRWRVAPKLVRSAAARSSGITPGEAGMAGFLTLRRTRDNLVWVLTVLAGVILAGAAFLRWNI